MTQPQTSEPTSTPIPEARASSSGQSVEITHSHAVARKRLPLMRCPITYCDPHYASTRSGDWADSLHQGNRETRWCKRHFRRSWACSWDRPLSFISLNIPPAVVEQVAVQTDHAFSTSLDLVLPFTPTMPNYSDESITSDEVQTQNSSGRLFDSLVNLLTVHLLRNYTSSFQVPQAPQRLTPQQISQAIDYLHAHMPKIFHSTGSLSPLTLAPLICGCSNKHWLVRISICSTVNQERTVAHWSFSVGEVAEVGFSDQCHLSL